METPSPESQCVFSPGILQGQVAIITGGGSGIGFSTAREMIRLGARVALCGRTAAKLDAARAQLGGSDVVFTATCDIREPAQVEEFVRGTLAAFGRIDILVNNAALFADLVKKPFWEIPAAEWDKVMAVNLKGPFLCSKAVYPQMKKQGKGKIINVASGAFYKGLPHFLHYVVSKGGNVAITRSLAREVGDAGITVNTIAPGYTETEFLKENPQDPPEVIRMASAMRCIRRPETPEDLTGAVVFLSSDDSDFITGQTIIVDGGSAFS